MNSHFSVAVRDAMVPVVAGQSFFQILRSLDVSAFELLVTPDGSFDGVVTENGDAPFSLHQLEALHERLQAESVSVCALLLGTDFSGPQAQRHVEWAVEAIKAAQVLGAPVVRLDPATGQEQLEATAVRENLVARLQEVLRQTSETGVNIGLENHGVFTNDPDFLDSVFAALDSQRVGLTLDIANFYWSGMPLSQLYQTIEHFAPRARHTHIKSIAYPTELREQQRPLGFEYGRYATSIDKGDIDLARVVNLLKDADYNGALCIENETLTQLSPAQSLEILRAEVAALRQLI